MLLLDFILVEFFYFEGELPCVFLRKKKRRERERERERKEKKYGMYASPLAFYAAFLLKSCINLLNNGALVALFLHFLRRWVNVVTQ
jgi:hypothetical protein